MCNLRNIFLVIFLLIIIGIFYMPAEEQPLDLSWAKPNVEKVYVPPGSAIKYLGELFLQVNINGGVHIGPSLGKYWFMMDEKTNEIRVSKPGDPDYCAEFSRKVDSVKEVLDSYCNGKNIFWDVKDNTVNMFTGDAKPGNKNILDIPLNEIVVERGMTFFHVFGRVTTGIKNKMKEKKDVKYIRNVPRGSTYTRYIMPDYSNVMEDTHQITRTYIFKDKTARYILNHLFKSVDNAIWILIETDAKYVFKVGSWHQEIQGSGAEYLFKHYMQQEIVIECKRTKYSKKALESGASYLYSGHFAPSFKEALMVLYVYHKNNPERVIQAIDKQISSPNGSLMGKYKKTEAEIQTWKDLKGYVQKPFEDYIHILQY